MLQVACLGEVKAVFWAKGVENIYFEDPETHYQVLESMEGYWIGEQEDRYKDQFLFLFYCREWSKESSRVGDFGCLGVLGILGCEMELNIAIFIKCYTSLIINIGE